MPPYVQEQQQSGMLGQTAAWGDLRAPPGGWERQLERRARPLSTGLFFLCIWLFMLVSLPRVPSLACHCHRHPFHRSNKKSDFNTLKFDPECPRYMSAACLVAMPSKVKWCFFTRLNCTACFFYQGTEFFFNKESGRIERHVESWEIKPIDALKQLIRPGRKTQSG